LPRTEDGTDHAMTRVAIDLVKRRPSAIGPALNRQRDSDAPEQAR
jgi:hypothetical protein